ncbi:hypothetical protein M673_23960 (plasmid) [Aureimonas sp. AU20]|uniref:hypothetical protein n=1 Tax=Aureimonas sp. AU20 TaxID=1349819 RepID=UPI0007216A91|nr:hypothetical protein [Aureimonas sp. AU20]ALN75810.1 hypothetical protein M673_23960 [Aureimonas sp. AU20]
MNTQADFYRQIIDRIREMRQNVDELEKGLEKIGVDGLSFNEWRGKLDEQEAVVQRKMDQALQTSS